MMMSNPISQPQPMSDEEYERFLRLEAQARIAYAKMLAEQDAMLCETQDEPQADAADDDTTEDDSQDESERHDEQS